MTGAFTSSKTYSSLKYDGNPIINRFTSTTEDQELIKFEAVDSTPSDVKIVNCNSITIESSGADLYFSIWRFSSQDDPEDYDWTNSPILFCPADSTMNISGVGIGAIKFSNASGAQYFISGLSI